MTRHLLLFPGRQVLLDPLPSLLRFVAHQRTARVLGRHGAGRPLRGLLVALHYRHQCRVDDQLVPPALGPEQRCEAVRLQPDLHHHEELLAPVPLPRALGLSDGRIRKLW